MEYTTSQVAQIIGIHPNTVRLYEQWGLVSPPRRRANGYRMFTDFHIAQFRLARTALQVEFLQSGLRQMAVDVLKASAQRDFAGAQTIAQGYLRQIRAEQRGAREALLIVRGLLAGEVSPDESPLDVPLDPPLLTRKQAAQALDVTIDTLRNWELNGLLTVKRKQNGYRAYDTEQLRRMRIIRTLRKAGYSLSAILRMLGQLSHDPQADIRAVLDTPEEREEIVSACDRLLTSLGLAEESAVRMLEQIARLAGMD
jgi:DNA-binding transcriptional MerR regulator